MGIKLFVGCNTSGMTQRQIVSFPITPITAGITLVFIFFMLKKWLLSTIYGKEQSFELWFEAKALSLHSLCLIYRLTLR